MTPDQEIANLLGAMSSDLRDEFHDKCKAADPSMTPEVKLEVLRQLIKDSTEDVLKARTLN